MHSKKLVTRKNAAIVRKQTQHSKIEEMLTGVSFPLENPSDVAEVIKGLKKAGVPYTAMGQFWGISERLISDFANDYIAGQRWANAANKVGEAVNRPYMNTVLAQQAEQDDDDDNSLDEV